MNTIKPFELAYRTALRNCWNCKNTMTIYNWPWRLKHETIIPPPAPIPSSIQMRYSKEKGGKYWVNTCPHCDSIQGDHYTHHVERVFRNEMVLIQGMGKETINDGRLYSMYNDSMSSASEDKKRGQWGLFFLGRTANCRPCLKRAPCIPRAKFHTAKAMNIAISPEVGRFYASLMERVHSLRKKNQRRRNKWVFSTITPSFHLTPIISSPPKSWITHCYFLLSVGGCQDSCRFSFSFSRSNSRSLYKCGLSTPSYNFFQR